MSFEQWSYELQTLRKSYSDSVLREGIQHSLRGAAADAGCNMGPNVPLDMILKMFTIIYGNVKSFNLLMRDFYRADQGGDETILFFTTRIEGILSQIRDRFPSQLPHQEEQRLLKDWLFHGSRKSIQDSVKYCFADASVENMHFLEESRKSEEEGKAGQAKVVTRVKANVAAATLLPTKEDELTKQLKYQQHQIDALVGQVKNLVSLVRATQPSSSVARTEGAMVRNPKAQGEEALREKASPLSQEPLFSLKLETPGKSRGLLNPISQTNAGSLREWGI